MIWTIWVFIRSIFKRKEKERTSPKFDVGDEVSIAFDGAGQILKSSSVLGRSDIVMTGKVLEVAYHSIDRWVYQVEYFPDPDSYSHIQYFGEEELDHTIQNKRNERLKELGL